MNTNENTEKQKIWGIMKRYMDYSLFKIVSDHFKVATQLKKEDIFLSELLASLEKIRGIVPSLKDIELLTVVKVDSVTMLLLQSQVTKEPVDSEKASYSVLPCFSAAISPLEVILFIPDNFSIPDYGVESLPAIVRREVIENCIILLMLGESSLSDLSSAQWNLILDLRHLIKYVLNSPSLMQLPELGKEAELNPGAGTYTVSSSELGLEATIIGFPRANVDIIDSYQDKK